MRERMVMAALEARGVAGRGETRRGRESSERARDGERRRETASDRAWNVHMRRR